MRTKQGTDFVSLLYAKQILMQRYKINVDTQFLEKAEGSFQDGRSRIRYFAISTGAPSSVGASLQGIYINMQINFVRVGYCATNILWLDLLKQTEAGFANVFELCQHEGGVTVIGRLSQCSHGWRPRGLKKFAVDKLRSATPVRVSLLSTVEAMATLVIKHRLRTLFCCNIHHLTLLAGLLLR